jgi:hypothetical protein
LGAVLASRLAEHVVDEGLDRLPADHEFTRDLAVGKPGGEDGLVECYLPD